MEYFADGEIRDWWSYCLPEEVKNLVDEWSTERFEKYPLLPESPFDRGDIVMDKDKIGVIDISKEDMEAGNARIRNGALPYCEYLDSASTIVQYIEEDGMFFYSHPSLLFLKKGSKEEIRKYAGMVSDMVQGKLPLDFFLSEYEKKIRQASEAGREDGRDA